MRCVLVIFVTLFVAFFFTPARKISFQGTFVAPGLGTYILIWDNSYSFLTSKVKSLLKNTKISQRVIISLILLVCAHFPTKKKKQKTNQELENATKFSQVDIILMQ